MSFTLRHFERSHCQSAHRFYVSAAFAQQPRITEPRNALGLDSLRTVSSSTRVSKKKTRATNGAKKERKEQEQGPFRPSLLEQSKVQDYLDHIASTKSEISLQDLERYKPHSHGKPGQPEYEQDYNALLDVLARSFTASQLRHFAKLYNLHIPGKHTKWECAVAIIEQQWKWPSLTDIQKKQRDWSEVSSETFSLTPRQCFLLLGKDGSDLLDLSRRYDVHISLSARPLCLKVEGLRGPLSQLKDYISQFKYDIEEIVLELPGKQNISPDLIERVSRLSNAFTENIGDGKVRISYRKTEPHSAAVAKRLAIALTCEEDTESSLLAFSPPGAIESWSPPALSQKYALYPFFPPQSLPWTLTSKGLFRWRRVGDWFHSNSTTTIKEVERLVEGEKNAIITLDGQFRDMRSQLSSLLPEVPGFSRTLKASPGHLLWTTPINGATTLTAPLKGVWQFAKILEWIRNYQVSHIFNPTTPPLLLASSATQQRVVHRLVYSAVSHAKDRDSVVSSHGYTSDISFEVILGSKQYYSENRSAAHHDESISDQDVKLEPFCRIGAHATLVLLMPDRNMDIRFSVENFCALERKQWPKEIELYYDRLVTYLTSSEGATQPDAPLTLGHNDIVYALKANTSVRQSLKTITAPTDGEDTLPSFETTSESVLNVDTNERITTSEVICDNIGSDKTWKIFLDRCDWLTTQLPLTSVLKGPVFDPNRNNDYVKDVVSQNGRETRAF